MSKVSIIPRTCSVNTVMYMFNLQVLGDYLERQRAHGDLIFCATVAGPAQRFRFVTDCHKTIMS